MFHVKHGSLRQQVIVSRHGRMLLSKWDSCAGWVDGTNAHDRVVDTVIRWSAIGWLLQRCPTPLPCGAASSCEATSLLAGELSFGRSMRVVMLLAAVGGVVVRAVR